MSFTFDKYSQVLIPSSPLELESSRSGEDDHRCHIKPFGYHVRIPLG